MLQSALKPDGANRVSSTYNALSFLTELKKNRCLAITQWLEKNFETLKLSGWVDIPTALTGRYATLQDKKNGDGKHVTKSLKVVLLMHFHFVSKPKLQLQSICV